LKLLLDTSFLLELKRGRVAAQRALLELTERASDVGISALTAYELYVGAFYRYLKRGDLSELAWLEELLGWITVYPVDRSAAEVAARVKAEAAAKGLQLPDVDLLIAASAGPGTTLLTFDSDHRASMELLRKYGIEVAYLEKGEG
jgi:predicted nucleic acid-binding protein